MGTIIAYRSRHPPRFCGAWGARTSSGRVRPLRGYACNSALASNRPCDRLDSLAARCSPMSSARARRWRWRPTEASRNAPRSGLAARRSPGEAGRGCDVARSRSSPQSALRTLTSAMPERRYNFAPSLPRRRQPLQFFCSSSLLSKSLAVDVGRCI